MSTATLTLEGTPCFSSPGLLFFVKWLSTTCCLGKRQTPLHESCEIALDDGSLPSLSRLSVLSNPPKKVTEEIAEVASEPLV